MNQTLYRKYRPQTFAEVEGQAHVVRTLQGALTTGQVGHAYLFCGPRGTGKTTLARLFAKALNCIDRDAKRETSLAQRAVQSRHWDVEPCNTCPACLGVNHNNSLDLIEIDAASNRGIDEIRNLKEAVRVVAPGGGYKVFIIDEVHMLTKDAFNALLKTLEEPPAQVVFILATTEPHKLLETILSRVQRFDLKPITREQLTKKLQRVAQAEKIKLEDGAVAALASYAGGSLRDAESALAKLMAYGGKQITAEHAAEILGIVPLQIHENLLAAISTKDSQRALAIIGELYESGLDLENFNKQFVGHTRAKLLGMVSRGQGEPQREDNVGIGAAGLVKIITAFVKTKQDFKHSPVPPLPLELAVLELINAGK